MSSNTKLLQKQLKTIIPSMPEKDLKRVFEAFRESVGESLQYTCKQLSFKCFEGVISIRGKTSAGYGRNDQEALCNAIKNILDILIEQDDLLHILKHSIKKTTQPTEQLSNKENQHRKSLTFKPNISSNLSILENTEGRKSKSNLKTNHIQSLNISLLKTTSNKSQLELELQGAKIYINQLQIKIKALQQENKSLKSKNQFQSISQTVASSAANPAPHPTSGYLNHSDYDVTRLSFDPKHKHSHDSHHDKFNSSFQQTFKKPETIQKKAEVKMRIPRLKLEVLPSYHGKSNKSINSSFMANQQALGK